MALKTLEWEEVTGTVADDDTLLVCTANNYDQIRFIEEISQWRH
jgi:arginine repressor